MVSGHRSQLTTELESPFSRTENAFLQFDDRSVLNKLRRCVAGVLELVDAFELACPLQLLYSVICSAQQRVFVYLLRSYS